VKKVNNILYLVAKKILKKLLCFLNIFFNREFCLSFEELNIIWSYYYGNTFPISIMFDGRYSSPRNAMEGTVVVCHT
jgi:hypothetical protein